MKTIMNIMFAILFAFALTSAVSAQAICGGCDYGPPSCSACHPNTDIYMYDALGDGSCWNCIYQSRAYPRGPLKPGHKLVTMKNGVIREVSLPDWKKPNPLTDVGRYVKAIANGTLLDLLSSVDSMRSFSTLSAKKFDHIRWARVNPEKLSPVCAAKIDQISAVLPEKVSAILFHR